MTPSQIETVKASYRRIASQRAVLGDEFYGHLFKLNPDLKPLFHGSLASQGRAFFSMMGLVVKCLDIREQVVPIIYELGRRHASYGVSAIDFTTFEEALQQTLGAALGKDFTPEVKDAWASAYAFMADLMGQACRDVQTGQTSPWRNPRRVDAEEEVED